MLSGVGAGDPVGDLLVLAGSAAYSLQIALMERYAPRYDPVAFTQSEMLSAFAGFSSSPSLSARSRCHAAGPCGGRCS